MPDASPAGRILWYELLTTDMKAAERFYPAVVGWTVTPFEGSPQPYDMWMRAGNIAVGGVMTIPDGMNFPPHWGMYVGVTQLEDAVATIERLGGSALSPVIEVPTVGRMRTMRDPQGAAFTDGAGGVLVRETFDAESQTDREHQRRGWQAILDNFARHVDAKDSAGKRAVQAHGADVHAL